MYDATGKRMTSQVTSGRDYSAQGAHPDLITEIPEFEQDLISDWEREVPLDLTPAFNEYEPPAIGTRFDVGTTCIEYAGEYYFEYVLPTEDDETEFHLRNSATGEVLDLVLSDFSTYDLPGYHAIWHSTINSGYLIRLTDDGEGVFLFHHWGA